MINLTRLQPYATTLPKPIAAMPFKQAMAGKIGPTTFIVTEDETGQVDLSFRLINRSPGAKVSDFIVGKVAGLIGATRLQEMGAKTTRHFIVLEFSP